jgi:hypothetical protein
MSEPEQYDALILGSGEGGKFLAWHFATTGFMKALVAADSDRILGFAMIGPEAGEVAAVVQTAMLAGMPYTGLRDAIFAHPTMAEGLGPLFSGLPAHTAGQ